MAVILDGIVDDIEDMIHTVECEDCNTLLTNTFRGAILDSFMEAPAARGMHHARRVGLAEHSLDMARLADATCKIHPDINRDLLITGALLHDIGKIWECPDGKDYTSDGQMFGHIILGYRFVDVECDRLGLDREVRDQVCHMILSHHGKLEWGSPVVPKTLEAIVLHQLDMIDSRIDGYFTHVLGAPTTNGWTDERSKMFGANLRY